jgi:hypothetical protein
MFFISGEDHSSVILTFDNEAAPDHVFVGDDI